MGIITIGDEEAGKLRLATSEGETIDNMGALVPVTDRDIPEIGMVPTVNARELHAYLEVKTRFNDWITSRIRMYGFVQDIDFVIFTEFSVKINEDGSTDGRGAPATEYYITLDMGKELGMVERTTKGREVRQYFIQCERRYRDAVKRLSPAELLLHHAKMLVDLERRQAKSEALSGQACALAQEALRVAKIAEAKAQASNQAVQDFTVMAYANISGLPITIDVAVRLGREAVRLSAQQGYPVGRAKDIRFGFVNTYVECVLEEVFEDYRNRIAEDI